MNLYARQSASFHESVSLGECAELRGAAVSVERSLCHCVLVAGLLFWLGLSAPVQAAGLDDARRGFFAAKAADSGRRFETLWRMKDGTERPVSVSTRRLPDDGSGARLSVGTAIDLLEIRQAQREMLDLEHMLGQAAESVIRVDAEREYREQNHDQSETGLPWDSHTALTCWVVMKDEPESIHSLTVL